MDFFLSLVIYAAMFIVSVGAFYAAEKGGKRWRKLLYIVVIAVPALVAAFRESGIDTPTYKEMYNFLYSGGRYGKEYVIEPLWLLLNIVMPTWELLLFSSAAIFLGVALVAIIRSVPRYRWLAWFIFLVTCYGNFLNGMRQMLAVAFVFLAIVCYLQKKPWRALLFVAMGTMFHKTAIFAIVIPFVLYFFSKVKRKEVWLVVLSAAMIALLPVMGSVLNSLGMYSSYVSLMTFEPSFTFLLYLVPPLFYYYKRKKGCSQNELIEKLLVLYLFAIPMQILGFFIPYADRMAWYFQVTVVTLVPKVIEQYDALKVKHELCTAYILWYVFHFVIMEIVLESGTFPYRDFFVYNI